MDIEFIIVSIFGIVLLIFLFLWFFLIFLRTKRTYNQINEITEKYQKLIDDLSICKTPEEREVINNQFDHDAISNDWKQVGDDMKRAIIEFEKLKKYGK